MMLNRLNAPTLHPIDKIEFIEPAVFEIAPKVKLFHMNEVANETCRFDLYFHAGSIQDSAIVSSLTSALLLSGTANKNAEQIQEEINALGGFFETGVSQENAVISIYALKENLVAIVKIVLDAIANCSFPEQEFHDVINERKQKYLVQQEKVSFLVQRAFQQRLFHDSPYGQITQIEDYNKVSREEVMEFHKKHYLSGLNKTALVGNFKMDEIDELIDLCGVLQSEAKTNHLPIIQNLRGSVHIEKKDALQTAIRVGRTLLQRNHPDYHDFIITNTILGDYFGSRLMSNIREDKGYTYGIGSMVSDFKGFSYFLIATEVAKEVKEATLTEIQFEIKRMQTERIEEEELNLVKNYLIGQMLKSADGPYSMMDLFLSAEMHDTSYDFYNEAIDKINHITSDRIQEIAQKYLNWEDFTIVTAG